MRKLIKVLILLLAIVYTAFSCEDEDFYNKTDAIIIYAGDPSVDGCGWLISISDTIYKPINLEEAFQVDSLEVSLEYQLLDSKWSCAWQLDKYTEVKVKNMQKRKK